MYKIRLHSRGGQGGKTAAQLIAEAAFMEGKEVQAFSLYGAERRGAPVASFVRIDTKPILERGYIHDPNYFIVIDESLLENRDEIGLNEGLNYGDIFLVNTKKSPKQIDVPRGVTVYTIDATGIAMKTMGRNVSNTVMLGAFVKISKIVKLESLEKAIYSHLKGKYPEWVAKNLSAVRLAHSELDVKSGVRS
ncbi:MAG: 2-oxoacid:acceptor oxidoreductase family protein [Candidatus Micrarchaeota archaeon]